VSVYRMRVDSGALGAMCCNHSRLLVSGTWAFLKRGLNPFTLKKLVDILRDAVG
jgi:hypothetical protein